MNTYADKNKGDKNKQTHSIQKKENGAVALPASNVNPTAATQLQEIADKSPQVQQAIQLQAMANANTAVSLQKKANNTGLPDNLKSGIENLSGHSLDDVKVHYNSDKPAELQAHAYAQGTDIHIASGQEKHLPHEAWHVVQQKQGRVKPTLQMKGDINVNDDAGLENEADIMGNKAMAGNHTEAFTSNSESAGEITGDGTVQRVPWPIVAGIAAFGAAAVWGLYRLFRGGNNEENGQENHEAEPEQQQNLLGAEEEEVVGPPVASRIHFVWLGGRVPDQRRDNILRWCAAMGTGTVIRLWMDASSIAASSEQIELLRNANVQIVNISTLAEVDERIATAVARLPTVNESGRVNPPATGALSDIIRLAALLSEGGTYMDSDNLPTSHSRELVGGQTPFGFRLGNSNGTMSNDAISAQPNNAFIERYLQDACDSLTVEQALIILSGNREDSIDAVMNSTGPRRLATLALPESDRMLTIVARYPHIFGTVPEGIFSITHIMYIRNSIFSLEPEDRNAFNAYLNRIGMTAFQREQGNAWLLPSQNSNGSGVSGHADVPPDGIPGFIPPPMPLALPALYIQNLAGITAANLIGTFSPEFLQFRDHRAAAMATLVAGGLDPAAVATIDQALDAAFLQQGAAALGAHPNAQIQQAIFDNVDVLYGRSLWALLRIFRAHGL